MALLYQLIKGFLITFAMNLKFSIMKKIIFYAKNNWKQLLIGFVVGAIVTSIVVL